VGSRRRCCCAGSRICITTCSGAIPLDGATITVTGLGSCTTDATGCCAAPWLTSGSHSYTVVDSAGDTLATASKTWTAGATNTVGILFPTTGKCCGVYLDTGDADGHRRQGTFTMKFAGTDGFRQSLLDRGAEPERDVEPPRRRDASRARPRRAPPGVLYAHLRQRAARRRGR
jgi:hypothetical protein